MTNYFPACATPRRACSYRYCVAVVLSLVLHMALVMAPEDGRIGRLPPPAAFTMVATLRPAAAIPEAGAPDMPIPSPPAPPGTRDSTAREAAGPSSTDGGSPAPASRAAKPPRSEAQGESLLERSTEYYTAQELDVYPTLMHPPVSEWRRLTAPGAGLTVMVTLDQTGRVEDIAALNASTERPADPIVREMLQSARFAPAIKSGRPVKSRIVLRLESDVARNGALP
ncbi:MAG: energy transducer TonB [Betaproteobacteria bacterium]